MAHKQRCTSCFDWYRFVGCAGYIRPVSARGPSSAVNRRARRVAGLAIGMTIIWLAARLVQSSPSGILRKRHVDVLIPQNCVQRRRRTRPTSDPRAASATLPALQHSAHCGECYRIGCISESEPQRRRHWTRFEDVTTLAVCEALMTVTYNGGIPLARTWRADGCQWHAVRHSDRVCYCGARGIHHRRRESTWVGYSDGVRPRVLMSWLLLRQRRSNVSVALVL